MNLFLRFGLGPLLGILCACGGGADPATSEGPDGPEEIGVVEEPLYEDTCWTQANPDNMLTAVSGQLSSAVSANAAYGQGNCPNQWVVDVTNIAGKGLSFESGPENQATAPPDWCPGFWSFTKIKGLRPGVGWVDIAEKTQTGQFFVLTPFGVAPWCHGTEIPVFVPSNHDFARVRLVVRAGFGMSYTRAKVMVHPN